MRAATGAAVWSSALAVPAFIGFEDVGISADGRLVLAIGPVDDPSGSARAIAVAYAG